LSLEGAQVKVASRRLERAQAVCDAVMQRYPAARLTPLRASSDEETADALVGAQLVVGTGAAGVELASREALSRAGSLRVAIDLNAVPPAGLGGVEAMHRGVEKQGIMCYGALGVGATKMKVHKSAIQRLFEASDRILDAEELYAIACEMT
jgi:hypothetical protein